MLWQSLRTICLAPGGPGSIWNYLGAPVRTTGVSRRVVCGFRTDLHFADGWLHSWDNLRTTQYAPRCTRSKRQKW